MSQCTVVDAIVDLFKEYREAVYLLDAEGAIIQLPFDLTVLFAGYIGRHNIRH